MFYKSVIALLLYQIFEFCHAGLYLGPPSNTKTYNEEHYSDSQPRLHVAPYPNRKSYNEENYSASDSRILRLLTTIEGKLNKHIGENHEKTEKNLEIMNDMVSKVEVIFDKLNAKNVLNEDTQNDLQTHGNWSENVVNKILNTIWFKIKEIDSDLLHLSRQETQIPNEVHSNNTIYFHQNNISSTINGYLAEKPVQDKSVCQEFDQINSVDLHLKNKDDSSQKDVYPKCIKTRDHEWLVIQSKDYKSNFNKSWTDYKTGFTTTSSGLNFYIGNDILHNLTNMLDLILRIELEDNEKQTAWAEYKTFKIDSEEKRYQLTVGGYTGNATDSLSSHNGRYFSTYDSKNDDAPECCPCAVTYGSGWWFDSCFESNLNGASLDASSKNYEGIIWDTWHGNDTLINSKMMLRKNTSLDRVESKLDHHITEVPFYEDP